MADAAKLLGRALAPSFRSASGMAQAPLSTWVSPASRAAPIESPFSSAGRTYSYSGREEGKNGQRPEELEQRVRKAYLAFREAEEEFQAKRRETLGRGGAAGNVWTGTVTDYAEGETSSQFVQGGIYFIVSGKPFTEYQAGTRELTLVSRSDRYRREFGYLYNGDDGIEIRMVELTTKDFPGHGEVNGVGQKGLSYGSTRCHPRDRHTDRFVRRHPTIRRHPR